MTRDKMFCRHTRAIQTHMILPFMCNMHQTLYGGRLMEYIDNCASISMSRLSASSSVTASMDTLNFIAPLPVTNTVCIETFVSGTGTSSAEIFVKVIGEDFKSGQRYLAATAFLTFVMVKKANQQTTLALPEVQAETAEEQYICQGYEERRQRRLLQQQANAEFNQNISIDLPWI